MQAKNNKTCKDAAYYVSRLKDLPADYLKQVQKLKTTIGNNRIVTLKFRQLCELLRLDDAKLGDAEFLEKSAEIFLGISILIEKFGLKLIPCCLPASLEADAELMLTIKPNLNNDDDVSYVQGILRSSRKLTERDMVYVQRMQLKLNNYNIMLRVFESLSIIKVKRLDAMMLARLDAQLNEMPMPIEGAKYLRSCYAYLTDHDVTKVNFDNPARCFKRMDKVEHNLLIAKIVKRIAGSVSLVYAPKGHPLYAEFNKSSKETARALAEAAAENQPDLQRLKISDKTIAAAIAEACRKAQLAARSAAVQRVSAGRAAALKKALIKNLKAESSLQPFMLHFIERTLSDETEALNLAPDFAELIFTLGNPALPMLQRHISLATADQAVKTLYPFAIFYQQVKGADGKVENKVDYKDPAALDLYIAPFKLPHDVPRDNVTALNSYTAAVYSFYLLQRSLYLGLREQSVRMFWDINNHCAQEELKAFDDLIINCGFFYYLYQHKITGTGSRPLPAVVLSAVSKSPVLLTLFAQRILRRSELKLSTLNESDLEVVLLYIMHLVKNAFNLEGQRNINLADVRTRRAFLAIVRDFCLAREKQYGVLFVRYRAGSQPDMQTFFEGLDVNQIYKGNLHNAFMQLIPRLLTQCVTLDFAAGQEVMRLVFSEDYAKLLHDLIRREPLISYLALNSQVLPVQLSAAINSPEPKNAYLHSQFPLEQPIVTTQLLRRFALESSNDIPILHYILDKADVFPLPILPPTIADLKSMWSCMRFLEIPPEFSHAEKQLLQQKLRVLQAALDFFFYSTKHSFYLLYDIIFDHMKLSFVHQREFVKEFTLTFHLLLRETTCRPVLQMTSYYLRLLTPSEMDECRSLVSAFVKEYLNHIYERISLADLNILLTDLIVLFEVIGLDTTELALKHTEVKEREARNLAQKTREHQLSLIRTLQRMPAVQRRRYVISQPDVERRYEMLEALFKLEEQEEEQQQQEIARARLEKAKRAAAEEKRRREEEERKRSKPLDLSLIRSKQKESSEILQVIGQIRDEGEALATALADAPLDAAADAGAGDSAAESAAEVSGDRGQQLNALLDVNALKLIEALKSQQVEVMDLREFEGLCLSAHFMSSSLAVEMLNDFAFEHFDEPFLELAPEENSVYISTHLIEEILPD